MFADIISAFQEIESMPAFLKASGMIILGLILIEGLLSVDNALGIAAMAAKLPKHQQKAALRWGLVGAYTFRGIALALVAWLMHNEWVKWFGAIYLVYLACTHLQLHPAEEKHNNHPAAVGARSFLATVMSIELMDLSLSLDNVVAAVGMVNNVREIPEGLHLAVVCLGVFIGIAALRVVAGWCIGVIEKHPILGYTAFLLVGFVGLALCTEMGLAEAGVSWHMGIDLKFGCISGIVLLSLLYERFGGLRTVLHPGVYLFRVLCTAFAWVVGLPFRPLKALLHRRG
ncbi:MAG: TerC family protein [Akkermansia muciniphila]|nr:hypothetical protein [Akkermansia muciniphila]MCI7003857.1 hypothetical protein [Akkermansia muciniphila]MDD6812987.1 hypothetical protein [Akkermansia muciniphila]